MPLLSFFEKWHAENWNGFKQVICFIPPPPQLFQDWWTLTSSAVSCITSIVSGFLKPWILISTVTLSSSSAVSESSQSFCQPRSCSVVVYAWSSYAWPNAAQACMGAQSPPFSPTGRARICPHTTSHQVMLVEWTHEEEQQLLNSLQETGQAEKCSGQFLHKWSFSAQLQNYITVWKEESILLLSYCFFFF